MKKIAITLSAATLLLGALVGCGADQGARGLGGADQRGFGYHTTDNRTDTGITGQRAGEGPITDMFTRDDQRGATGLGRDGRNATGLAGERGMTGNRAGQRGLGGTGHGAKAGQGGAGFGGAGAGTGHGGFGGAGMGGTGTGQGGVGLGGGDRTSGYGAGVGRTGFDGTVQGTDPAGIGMQGETGYTGGTRGMNGGVGFGADARRGGMRGTATGEHGRGIVGNKDGYVDNRGILRGEGTTGRTGIGGLGQTGRTNNMGQGAQPGIGHTGQGTQSFSYPQGYDTQSVNRIANRVEDVENVRDCRVVVNEDKVIVGAEVEGQNRQEIEQEIRQTVQNMVGNKEVVVVTERQQFDQVRNMDNGLRNGGALEEFGATFNDMFQDFGRAMQRPFERSR